MATTGGTNLRDDIMRLDDTGGTSGLVVKLRTEILITVQLMVLILLLCQVPDPCKFKLYFLCAFPPSTRGDSYTREDSGPYQERSSKSGPCPDDCSR